MSNDEHILERLANKLAEEVTMRVDLMAESLKPSGSRPPFTQQFSKPKALAWWRQNRYTSLGEEMLSRMSPKDVLELDTALREANDRELMIGGLSETEEYI